MIEAIDLTARTVTIRGDKGSVVTIDVPQSVVRFEELKVGDVVSATYYDRVSVRPKPPGEAAVDRTDPPLRTQTPGALPGATVVSQRVATVTLTGWDPATRTVTFTGPKGAVYSRRLLDTADPSIVAGIKLGDRVDVTRTEAVNIGVESRTTVDATAAPASEDGFRMGAFTFKPGGRIKLDIIRDFDPIDSEDSFDPRTIPVDGSEGTNSNIHARETRLSLDMRGPFEGRELRMYVEGDFYGSGNAFRLRQAFGTYGGLLAGQTWSVFVDENNFPNTIDFESPMAFPSIRQAQVRYTHKFGDKSSWSVGLEDNKSAIETPANIAGEAEFPMPDLTTHVRLAGDAGHVFASGFLGKVTLPPGDRRER